MGCFSVTAPSRQKGRLSQRVGTKEGHRGESVSSMTREGCVCGLHMSGLPSGSVGSITSKGDFL